MINKIRCKRKTTKSPYYLLHYIQKLQLNFLKDCSLRLAVYLFSHHPCRKTSLFFCGFTFFSLLDSCFLLVPLCYFFVPLLLLYSLPCLQDNHCITFECSLCPQCIGKPPEGRAFVHHCIPHI